MRATRHVPVAPVMTIVVLAIGLCCGGALAQEPHAGGVSPDSGLAPAEFGTEDEAITVIGSTHFFPPGSQYGYDSTFGQDRRRWCSGCAGASLEAPVDVLPNGSVLTQLVAYIYDNSVDDSVGVSFCRSWVDSNSGTSPGFDCPVSVTSNGTPGDSYLAAVPNLPIVYRQDVDGDGVDEVVNYTLFVYAPSSDAAIRTVRLRWKRQVSPAPQAATFNDVPTSDGAFQYIEALVASGITVGCGGGNYCPDAPLTRRQMAVFLAKALGLHWPWDAQ